MTPNEHHNEDQHILIYQSPTPPHNETEKLCYRKYISPKRSTTARVLTAPCTSKFKSPIPEKPRRLLELVMCFQTSPPCRHLARPQIQHHRG
mmetsp:Transcript_26256/g.53818  ORF Transcript_26256/g.53818 Transcript_26256/m.53818 type:complete len:92 (+) Transcript_26256:115-390(+)